MDLMLEDFDLAAAADPDSGSGPGPATLDTYDAGYRAGWDDALAAQDAGTSRLGHELGQNLKDLGFTYGQARAEVMRQIEPVLRAMVEKVLPELARMAIAPLVVDRMLAIARGLAGGKVEICLHPNNLPTVDRLTDKLGADRPTLVADDTMGEGQAILRSAAGETKVDLDGVLQGVGDAMTAYCEQTKELRSARG